MLNILVDDSTCDVSSQEQVNQSFESIYQRAGKLDILVNNAGVASVGTVETTDEEDFDRVLRTNVKGAYNCIHAVVGRMKRAGSGVILNISRTQPIGRMGQPREVAALARYLCSDEASFITGTDFPLDGGFIKLQA